MKRKKANEPQAAGTQLPSTGIPDLDKLISFYEWILDVDLPLQTRLMLAGTYQGIMNNPYQRAAELATIQQQIATITQVVSQDRDTIVLWRETHQAAFVDALRASPDILSQQFVALYDQANAPLAPGEPPLTEESLQCSLELFYFMAAVVQNVSPASIEIPPTAMRKWKKYLTRVYPDLPQEERNTYANLPLFMANLRVKWPGMAEHEKQTLRIQGARTLMQMQSDPELAKFIPSYMDDTPSYIESVAKLKPPMAPLSSNREEQHAIQELRRQMKTTDMLISWNKIY